MRLRYVLLLLAFVGCQSSSGGNAMVSEGVALRMTVFAPTELAEGAEGTIDIDVSNSGAAPVGPVLVDVAFPPQIELKNESHGMGTTLLRDPKIYRYTIYDLGVGAHTHIRYTVRTHFDGASQAEIHIVAELPQVGGDHLTRTIVIRMAK